MLSYSLSGGYKIMTFALENDAFDQAQLLEGMLIDIKEHSYYMRKSIVCH